MTDARQHFSAVKKWLVMRKRPLLLVASILLTVEIGLQIFYPSNRALPLSQVDGRRIGIVDQQGMQAYLDYRYGRQPLEVKTGDVTTKTTLAEAGLPPDYTYMHTKASNYPFWQRLIPLSLIVKPLLTNIDPQLRTDNAQLASFADKVVLNCNLTPENAQLSIKDSEVVLSPSRKGRNCQADEIKLSLKAIKTPSVTSLTPPVEVVEPERSDEQLQPLVSQAKSITNRGVSFKLGDKTYPVPKETLAGWIKFTEDEKTKAISLGLDKEKVTQYLLEQEKKIYVAPGTTVVTVENGAEISRSEGTAGLGLDKAATAQQIENSLLKSSTDTVIQAKLATLPAKVRYNRNYNNDQTGLDLLLADLVREKGNYGIALYELSGQKRISSAEGGKRFITASTYKLFVAYAVLKEVEAGRMSWNQEITRGRNLDRCFEDMIVKSDNPCAETLGKKLGWKNIQGMMQGLGMKNTFLAQAPTYDNYSTASDEALFLAKLERGELVQGDSRERLLSAMKRQVYRQGIPAGTSAPVADKVGFLFGLLHDASIVYNPKGTYVLVVLTDDSSWDDIADTTRRIETLLAK